MVANLYVAILQNAGKDANTIRWDYPRLRKRFGKRLTDGFAAADEVDQDGMKTASGIDGARRAPCKFHTFQRISPQILA
jgi:hypothetical protein